jgi:hypothetical protein
MRSICVLLTIIAVVQITQPSTSAQTATNKSKVSEQGIEWSPDRIALIEYVPERDEIVVTYVHLTEAQDEYRRLTAKRKRNDRENRRYCALMFAIGSRPTCGEVISGPTPK